jgi:hypothetical protein
MLEGQQYRLVIIKVTLCSFEDKGKRPAGKGNDLDAGFPDTGEKADGRGRS